MAAVLVNVITSEKQKEMDWAKSIEICELVANDPGQAKDVIKVLRKRLGNKNPNSLLFTVMLLEMLMNNCGEHIHRQVIELGLLPILVKIAKRKTDLPVQKKIYFLLDATQASFGGASAKYPEYHAAYSDLVNAGIQFPVPQRSAAPLLSVLTPKVDANSSVKKPISAKQDKAPMQSTTQSGSESSIIQKAASALELLQEVLDAINPQHPEGVTDEFTLDLVEQCSFQKQRVMHLAMTSRDEKFVSEAIELNEQLQKVLSKHDAFLSAPATTTPTSFQHEEVEDEDANQLFRRSRKGKASTNNMSESYPSSSELAIGESMHQSILQPACNEPLESSEQVSTVRIPPPPAKYIERERFFKEKQVESSALPSDLKGLSLRCCNGSHSNERSTDSSK